MLTWSKVKGMSRFVAEHDGVQCVVEKTVARGRTNRIGVRWKATVGGHVVGLFFPPAQNAKDACKRRLDAQQATPTADELRVLTSCRAAAPALVLPPHERAIALMLAEERGWLGLRPATIGAYFVVTSTGEAAVLRATGEQKVIVSRMQLIQKGLLVDVSAAPAARIFGGRPVAFTRAAYDLSVGMTPAAASAKNTVDGRLWDVLRMLMTALRAGQLDGDACRFELCCVTDRLPASIVKLKGVLAPGDYGDPVWTIMLPDED